MTTEPDGGGWEQPQPYHRALRTRSYAWWRPLLGLGVLAVIYLPLAVLAAGVPLVVELVLSDDQGGLLDRFAALDLTPTMLLATNLSLAAIMPAVGLALLAGHLMAPSWLSSVVGRLRWGLLSRMTGAAVVVVAVAMGLSLLVPVDDARGPPVSGPRAGEFAAYLVVVALSTPLQAAGEEYGFRGYGLQAIGAWVRAPWVPVVVTSLLFALAHGAQSPPLFLDRFAFGVAAAVLVLRTGGLEAAIALHTVNNAAIFALTAATGGLAEALAVSDVPWTLVLIDLLQLTAFTAWALRIARRRQVSTLTPASTGSVLEASPRVGYPALRPAAGRWGMG